MFRHQYTFTVTPYCGIRLSHLIDFGVNRVSALVRVGFRNEPDFPDGPCEVVIEHTAIRRTGLLFIAGLGYRPIRRLAQPRELSALKKATGSEARSISPPVAGPSESTMTIPMFWS